MDCKSTDNKNGKNENIFSLSGEELVNLFNPQGTRTRLPESVPLLFSQSESGMSCLPSIGIAPDAVTDLEREALKNWELSDRELSQIKHDLRTLGKQPGDELVHVLKESRVLAIGEEHHEADTLRESVAHLMRNLKSAGATHLLLEMPKSNLQALNKFLASGVDDPSDPHVYHHPDFDLLSNKQYQELLLSTRDAGLQIQAIDLADYTHKDMAERNQAMAEGIIAVLKADPNNKAIFWGGNLHLEHTGEGHEYKSLAEHLRQSYKVTTVWTDTDSGSPLVLLSGNSPLQGSIVNPRESAAISAFMSSDPKILKDSIPYGKFGRVFIIRK